MSQSLVQNYVHIIFSTKHRQPYIDVSVQGKLYNYMAGICSELGCHPIKIGGYDDHVHILCRLASKIALSELVQVLKSNSSRWFRALPDAPLDFSWQNGYGAFSVDSKRVPVIDTYISNQRQHHTRKGFMDEYRRLMNEERIAYDERYIWD